MKGLNKYLEDLARNANAFTECQILTPYFGNDAERMRRTLRANRDAGWITISRELVRSRIADTPIAIIGRGECSPCAHHLAYLAEKRWSREILPTLIIRGTTKLAALYGGQIRTVAPGHLSHEVALTDVFLAKRAADPAFEWTLIQAAPGSGALPDAIAGETAIELTGRYNAATVAAKLGISATRRLELW